MAMNVPPFAIEVIGIARQMGILKAQVKKAG
jgi:hypothetical protein